MRRFRFIGQGVAALAFFVALASAATAATRMVPENNPTVVAMNGRAIALYDSGKYDQAIAVLDELIRKFPDSGLAYANRGGIYFKIRKFDEAIKDYTQAIGLGRNDPVVVLNRGTAYFSMGDYDRALEDCNAIVRVNPRNAVAYRTCGIAYEAKGDRERAFSNFDESVRLDPRAAKTYQARGLAYGRSGQPDKALADLTEAARLDPAIGKDTEVAEATERAKVALTKAPAAAVAAAPSAPKATAEAEQSATQSAPDGEIRVALVIGNSDYVSVPRLPNPQVDAGDVAKALRVTGFKTVELDDNLGAAAMRQALNDFSAQAARADWALVYYAGHGIEVNGTNYLIPTDAKLKTDLSVQFEAIPLDNVLASVEGAHKLRIVVLDACRDNPFLRDMARTTASRSVGRGLGRVEPDTGATLVAYSAKAGQVAMDGKAGETNSPFARALIRNMQKPGVEVRKFFGLIRDEVMAATGNAQEPYVYGSLGGEDYFFRKP